MTDVKLIETIAALKEAYIECACRRLGKDFCLNEKSSLVDTWKPVARVVIKLNADPKEYIQANFKYRKEKYILINTLHSSRSQNCYRKAMMFSVSGCTDNTDSLTEETEEYTPAQLDILSRIADLKYLLSANKYAPDLQDYKSRKYILSRVRGFIDPLAAMILSPDDEMFSVYGKDAINILNSNPKLKEAMISLDLRAALMYIESRHDEAEHNTTGI